MSGQSRPSASGLTAFEIDLLRSVEECTAVGAGLYAPSSDVLERVETRTGVGPRYTQQMLADLTAGSLYRGGGLPPFDPRADDPGAARRR